VNEAVLVQARIGRHGRLRPQAFTWRDKTFTVGSIGRQWADASETHVLVMAEGAGTFELAYSPATSAWRVLRSPADFGPGAHA
jgi:hypothetical protein